MKKIENKIKNEEKQNFNLTELLLKHDITKRILKIILNFLPCQFF
jgi:hypothetical protein